MGARAERQIADLCRALAHPARVRILRVLVEKDVCIAGELAG
jgi:DNA-binding transcriptional ArsR family regulator